LADQLHHKACVALRKCGIEEVKMFQAVLPQYQIHVLSKDHFNGIINDGVEGGVPIYLYCPDEHFDAITKITGFLNRSYFCDTCKKVIIIKSDMCVTINVCTVISYTPRQTRIGSCVINVTFALRINCALKCM